MPGAEWVMPSMAIVTMIGNAAISWAAVKRLEDRDGEKELRIRSLEMSVAVLKAMRN